MRGSGRRPLSEFTGERLVPGQVDAGLWNEHISRYAFAASLCAGGESVLDAGCGTGYGSSFLGGFAGRVLGIDSSGDAIGYAAREYGRGGTRFAVGACEALPVSAESCDLIVAFEVIEHLAGWRVFLEECGRALAPRGRLVVSTPNKNDYTESRGAAGPNPFHVHEFEFAEFADELARIFPVVRIFGQNHAESIVFAALESSTAVASLAAAGSTPEEAGFFVAVCGKSELPETPNFIYVPRAANLLRERERHIRLLTGELEFKNVEMAEAQREHAGLVERFREQQAELEKANGWAESLNRELEARGRRVAEIQDELAREQQAAQAEVERLQILIADRTAWARDLDASLAERGADLVRSVDLLHAAEQTIEERTNWALSLDEQVRQLEQQRQQLQGQFDAVYSARWSRLGRRLHVGPRF